MKKKMSGLCEILAETWYFEKQHYNTEREHMKMAADMEYGSGMPHTGLGAWAGLGLLELGPGTVLGLNLGQYNSKLICKIVTDAGTPVEKSPVGSDGDPVSDPTLYRSLAGALQYLTFTSPDLSDRILRYVRGTIDHGLQLYVSSTSQLTAYTDADWAGCPVTRRSTSGYCVFLGDNLLSWSAKRQVTLSRSSAEAEYRGVANVVAETAWIRNLLLELHTPLFTATLVYCDNVSAVYLSTNPVQHQRTKHIEIDIHFVREYVASGQVRVLHVPSRFQYADIFTKGLPTALFLEFRSSLNVRRSPAHTEGEY
ncbi:ribonuclease H-like domain-containing protein [Tanacetum coccineum]